MDRRPEPELMDSQEQTLAYADADFSESNSLFVDSFMAAFPGLPREGRLADLGCGPADICIRLAHRLPGWRITALDAGENMLRRAGEAISAEGLEGRIELRLSHLPDPALGRGVFDAVTSNSLLHHLPDPATLWDSLRQVGAPGAALAVMDLRRPVDEASAEALVDEYAKDAPPILREDFYNSLQAAYTPSEIRQQLDDSNLAHLQLLLPSDRHWLVTGSLPEGGG